MCWFLRTRTHLSPREKESRSIFPISKLPLKGETQGTLPLPPSQWLCSLVELWWMDGCCYQQVGVNFYAGICFLEAKSLLGTSFVWLCFWEMYLAGNWFDSIPGIYGGSTVLGALHPSEILSISKLDGVVNGNANSFLTCWLSDV